MCVPTLHRVSLSYLAFYRHNISKYLSLCWLNSRKYTVVLRASGYSRNCAMSSPPVARRHVPLACPPDSLGWCWSSGGTGPWSWPAGCPGPPLGLPAWMPRRAETGPHPPALPRSDNTAKRRTHRSHDQNDGLEHQNFEKLSKRYSARFV